MERSGLSAAVLSSGFFVLLFSMGGAHGWAPSLVAIFGGLSILIGIGTNAKLLRPRLSIASSLVVAAVVFWVCWLAWIAFQLTPIPDEYASFLPDTTRHLIETARAQGLATPYRISVSVHLTAQALILSIGLFAVYMASRQIGAQRKARNLLLWLLLLAVVAQSLYGIWGLLTGNYWPLLHSVDPYQPHAHGTLLNRNHFAGLLNLGAGICLALLLNTSSSRTQWRSFWRRYLDPDFARVLLLRIFLLTLVIGTVLSQSRMGNLSLAIAMTITGIVWILLQKSAISVFKAFLLFLSIAVLDVLVISSQFGLEKVQERITETDLSAEQRGPLNAASLALITKFEPIGSGHGTYPKVIQVERPGPTFPRAIHAHNDYFEFLIGAGIVGFGLLLTIMLIHCVLAAKLLTTDKARYQQIGLLIIFSMSACAIHAVTEFNLQVPAYAYLMTSLLGIAAGAGISTSRSQHTKRAGQAKVALNKA